MGEGKDYLLCSPPGSVGSAEDVGVAEVVEVVVVVVVVEVDRIVESPVLKVVAVLDVDCDSCCTEL